MFSIKLRDVSYVYPNGNEALKKITFQIKSGEKVALMGANGSGKSTLLQHLNGLIPLQSGEIFILDQVLCKKNIRWVRQHVGYVFDNPDHQIFSSTVEADVSFGPLNLKMNPYEMETRVSEALNIMDISHLRQSIPQHLSLGQKKRVAIAGVLAMEPSIIVMDEPFSGLDPYTLEHFIQTLNALSERGHTLIIASHDVETLYSWATQCIILSKGEILSMGDTSLLSKSQLMKEAKLRVPYQLQKGGQHEKI